MSSSDAGDPTTARVNAPRASRTWKFFGTLFWGLFIFAAMFAGQLAVIVYFIWSRDAALDIDTMKALLGSGLTISLSVVTGLPAVLAAIWLATRMARMPFGDYLALRGTSWKNVLIAIVSLVFLVTAWDLVSKAAGRDVAPGFMGEVLKSAVADNSLWLLFVSFCIVAPISEEFFARGFLYRGWSESFLRPFGAIILSSLVWTFMHLQYDWFFLGQVFTMGLLFGHLRYRSNSTWLTVGLHGLNNLAATLQTLWLTSQS